MSAIRPDLAARLRRWREPLAWGALLLLGLALIWRGYQALAPLTFAAGLLAAAAGAGLLRPALRRVSLAGAAEAEGVVVIDEARIGYLGPREGGFVDLPTLVSVEVRSDARNGAVWVLRGEEAVLAIPFGARGAAMLLDALSALPGIDFDAALRAAAGERQHVSVWKRPDPRRPRLR